MYKLICFDLDGTLIDDTIFIWQTIHDHFGTNTAAREKAKQQFFNAEITYEAWAKHDIALWKQVGATKRHLLDAIKPLKLMQGARETMHELKRRGYIIAVISGSIDFALEYVFPDYKQFVRYVYINKIHFDAHEKLHDITPTRYDLEHKATALQELTQKEGISLQQCIFVGDHHNDIAVAKISGMSIAFNSKSPELNAVCDVVIAEKDLRKILVHCV